MTTHNSTNSLTSPSSATLGFIGFGKMAKAIWSGINKQGLILDGNARFFDINGPESTTPIDGIRYASMKEVVEESSLVIIGVKPQNIHDVLAQVSAFDLSDTCFISILAGTPISTFKNALGDIDVVRVMPNTPAMVNAGVSAVCTEQLANQAIEPLILSLFECVGHAIVLPESMFDMVTAISGSGPAFFYQYVMDMVLAAKQKGMPESVAIQLATQTMKGAAELILHQIVDPESASTSQLDALIKQVTSPGGTTFAGLNAYKNADISEGVESVIHAAYNRSIELGKES